MIRALIVDDEPLSRRVVRDLLETQRDFVIAGESEDGASALAAITEMQPDVVFLDVQMPGLTGLDVVRELDPASAPLIVFATAYDHFAVQAFEASALDYVLKPIEATRFEHTLSRIRATLGVTSDRRKAFASARELAQRTYRQRIVVKTRERIFFVNAADVDWLEAAANYVRVHAGPREHLVRTTLQQLESELDPARFVRIHRSAVVNLERIAELRPFFRGALMAVLATGKRLEVQKPYRERLMALFDR